jgi:CheY-like chemotaxis protein
MKRNKQQKNGILILGFMREQFLTGWIIGGGIAWGLTGLFPKIIPIEGGWILIPIISFVVVGFFIGKATVGQKTKELSSTMAEDLKMRADEEKDWQARYIFNQIRLFLLSRKSVSTKDRELIEYLKTLENSLQDALLEFDEQMEEIPVAELESGKQTNETPIIKVFLVDDHKVVIDGLRRMLENEDGITVVGEAYDGIEALNKLKSISPDIILTNIKMPEMDGLEFTRQVKLKYPSYKVIMQTLIDQYLNQALEAGASGYLLKDVKRDELVKAIMDVYQGQEVISPHLKKPRKKHP